MTLGDDVKAVKEAMTSPPKKPVRFGSDKAIADALIEDYAEKQFICDLTTDLQYDPSTGDFRWKTNRGKANPGSVAGTVDENGRRKICFRGKRYMAHRLAFLMMLGRWPTHEIDHINGDQSDNRWSNLREATRSQNEANKGRKANNTSGAKGVYPVNNRWRAEITMDGRRIHIGYFDTKDEAADAYDAEAERLFGEFHVRSRHED